MVRVLFFSALACAETPRVFRGVAGHFLRPLGAMLGAHIRSWWVRGGRGGKGTPEVEGNGAQWLRGWIGSILTPTAAASYTR